MKQSPSNLKFKKYHKLNFFFAKTLEKKRFFPINGNYALKSLEYGKLTFRHIEAGRRTIRRTTKKTGRLWIRMFPYVSVSKKAAGARMGKGKGAHSYWICPIKQGQILYELSGVSSYVSLRALYKAGTKMPVKTKVVSLMY